MVWRVYLKFGKILKVSLSILYAFGRIFIYTVCKWHNFEQLIQPSGHADHAKIDFLFSTLKISDTSTFIRQGFKLSLGS